MKNFYLSCPLLASAKRFKLLGRFAAILAFAILFSDQLFAQAPTISYNGPNAFFLNKATTLPPTSSNVAALTGAYNNGVVLGSGLSFSINGVALDAAGNMYVNDIDGSTGEVKKISADGSSTTIIGSGFLAQSANIAVDQNGNVFVADQGTVWEIPASGSPVTYGTPFVINNTFSRPFGIAVDVGGNIYVTDLTVGGVYKMANDGSGKVRIDDGSFANGTAVTVDAAGNVYVTDYVAGTLYEIPANSSTPAELANGFAFPRGLAVDAAGTVYVDDEGNSGIFAVPAGGGTKVAVVSGLSNLVGVAVDPGYNLYGALQGAGGITKFAPTGGFFISPVLPAGLSLDNTTGIIRGTPTAVSTATNYLVSAYNANGGASATVNISTAIALVLSYGSPQTYTAGTAITALDPSVTTGAVASPGYSATSAGIGSGFNEQGGVTVDAAGNVYVANPDNAIVEKLPAGGGSPVNIGSGFSYPTGVAVDAAGDVFVADPGNGLVSEITHGGSQSTLGSGFVAPIGVAVDQSGNVYVIDGNTNTLYKIPAGNGTPVVLGLGFTELTAVAVDQSGNLYVVDGGASTVFEVPEKGGIPVSLGGSFVFPTGVAVDASGTVYVADYDAGAVYKLSACGCTQVAISTDFFQPIGLAVDGADNIYVAATGNNLAYVISPAGGYYVNIPLPAGLSMDATTGEISGKPKKVSAATNYTVTGWNADGPGSATVSITVVAPPAPSISYATPQAYVAGTAITPLSPSNIGGTVAFPAYSDSPVSIGSGFSSPFGVATDAAGDVYIADAGSGDIKEIAFGTTTAIIVASGFDYPTAVTIDAAGDLFIADQGAHAVYEIPFGGSQQTIASLDAPDGVAVDASGNVFVSDETTNSVYELGSGSPVVIESGFYDLTNIALDKSGNLYILDGGGSALYEVPESGGIPIPIGNFFLYPTAVTVDAQGNVYVADGDAGTIFKLPNGTFGQFAIANGFNEPGGVAVDGAGNVYVGDTNDNVVAEVKPAGGYFINVQLPAGLNIDGKTGIISGTATGASPATNYTVTAYNAGGNSAAVVNITVTLPPAPTVSYVTPQRYPQGTAIVPLSPTATNVDLPAYSSTLGTVGSGFSFPYGVAVDKKGNIFIADAGNATVWELPVGGGAQFSIGSGFAGPTGVAVDTTGNIYVADAVAGSVVKVPAGGGAQVSLGTGYNYPGAIAADAAGNVYVADAGHGKVYKIAIGRINKITFASGFSYPVGVAVDNAGNVYIADEGSGVPSALYEIAAGSSTQTTINYNFNLLTGVAADASGNIFAADGGVGRIIEFPSGGGADVTIPGLSIPEGLAADGAGNLYVADIGTNNVDKINPSGGYYVSDVLPAGLSFSSTTGAISGTPTAVSPAKNYTVSAYNVVGGSTAAVNIQVLSTNANLSRLGLTHGILSPVFATGVTSYTASVINSVSSISVKPTTSDPGATVLVNTTDAVTSGTASAPIALATGPNTITVMVTAQDGVTTNTYTIIVTRAPSDNPNLATIKLNPSLSLTKTSETSTEVDYTASARYGISTVTVTPTTIDTGARVTVNGAPVTSGTPSAGIPLAVGQTTITTVVTAQDLTTQKTYIITVTRAPSDNANMGSILLNPQLVLTQTSATSTEVDYTASAKNAISSVTVTPIPWDPTATVTVQSKNVTPGTPSDDIPLAVGQTVITTVITAGDGTTQKTYVITVTRAAGSVDSFDPGISVTKPTETPTLAEDGIQVHQGISPNGDGINDFLMIDNISQYPDNRLAIMNRNGQLVYEANGYDNSSKVFDGHSNKNGQMQLPGTYFYQLDYTISGTIKHKTGFIILKY